MNTSILLSLSQASVDIRSLFFLIECYWEEVCGCLTFPPCNWLIFKYFDFVVISVHPRKLYLYRDVSILMILLLFPGTSDIPLFRLSYFPSQIWANFVLPCFVLLSTREYLLSVCWISVFKLLPVMFSTSFHLLVLFLCILCSFFEDCFLHHQLWFWFVDFTSYYFNIFIGSAVIIIFVVSFFLQLPASLLSPADVLSYLWSLFL